MAKSIVLVLSALFPIVNPLGGNPIFLSIFLSYGFAERLAQTLGATAMSVIMRLSSFLLVCIGVQILWNGASTLLASVPVNVR